MKNVSTIGSGVGGLATAIRLAVKGYKVRVYEKQANAGGKLNQIFSGGFRFDTGPSLFTLPGLVDELAVLAGKPKLKYQKLEIITKYFFPDGKVLNAYSEPEKFAHEVQKVIGEPAGKIETYLRECEELYKLIENTFIFNPFPRFSNLFSIESLKLLLNPTKLKALNTMHQVNARYFQFNQTAQLFDRYATYNGSDPYKAPGTLTIIPHLEHNIGAFFPEKGMYSIAEYLQELALDLGVEFSFDTHVEKILLNNRKVIGIRVNGENIDSDYVVNNADIFTAYKTILTDVSLTKKLASQQPSSSALIFYWGVKGSFNQLELHNILFSENYEYEFKAIGVKGVYIDPTVYIYITSKLIREDAPQGHENWFVMINVPENTGQNWEDIRIKCRENILKKIKKMLGIDLAPLIVYEDFLDPIKIENKTGSYKGSLYGISSNSRMAAFNRHPNRSGSISGLYFSGGSVHPGGGIPLCLASAKIVDSYYKPIR